MDRNLLHKVFSSEATEQEIRIVQEWTEADASNKEIFIKERRLFDSININLYEIPAHKNTRNRKFRFLVISSLAVAACSLLLLFFSHIHLCNNHRNNCETVSQTISTTAGQSSKINLPDGSIVYLNSLSSITYPINFGKKERQVTLSGEAYFEVSKDNNRPFIVKTSYGDIKVLGTVFNVEAYSDMDEFVTSLFSGSVQVTSNCKEITLEPNKMAYLENGCLTSGQIVDYNHFRWRDGFICFMDQNIIQILRSLTKAYGYEFKIEDSVNMKKKFSGKFRKNDNVINILSVLQTVINFEFDVEEDEMTITLK